MFYISHLTTVDEVDSKNVVLASQLTVEEQETFLHACFGWKNILGSNSKNIRTLNLMEKSIQ
jgi:hypothetical protein